MLTILSNARLIGLGALLALLGVAYSAAMSSGPAQPRLAPHRATLPSHPQALGIPAAEVVVGRPHDGIVALPDPRRKRL